MYKKILSFFLAFATIFSLSVSTSAADSSSDGLVGVGKSFMEWCINTQNDAVNSFWKLIYGDDFNSSGYSDYVSGLESDLGTATVINGGIRMYGSLSASKGWTSSISITSSTSNNGTVLSVAIPANSTSNRKVNNNVISSSVVAPFQASYSAGYIFSSATGCSVSLASGFTLSALRSVTKGSTMYLLNSNGGGSNSLPVLIPDTGVNSSYTLRCYYDLTPFAGAIQDNTTYNISITSRPTSLVGSYSSGDTVYNNVTIVNEDNSTIYNPVTDTTTDYSTWAYDYSTRTYILYDADGNIVAEVSYNDDDMTIIEGDTTYVYNYYIGDDTSDTGDAADISGFFSWWKTEWTNFRVWLADALGAPDPTHTHSYVESIVSESTCLTSGMKTLVCSCGDSYTETTPKVPHDWTLMQSVPAETDDDGTVLVAAYDLYVCSMCGRLSQVPVDTTPETDIEENTEKDSALDSLGLLRDLLSFFWNGFGDFIHTGIGEFISGAGDPTGEMFGLLGTVDWTS